MQGRRLRHVNDEIKLRKWREAQQQQQGKGGGDGVDAKAAMFDTPSGLYNWHLMVPSWADISKKGTRKIQREFQRLQREQDRAKEAKKEKQAQHERMVANYVNKATEASKEVQSGVLSALQQGLQAQQERKRKRQDEKEVKLAAQQQPADDNDDVENGRPSSLCTLSGDVIVEEKTTKLGQGPTSSKCILQIQSQSDFATLALFLDKPISSTIKSINNKKQDVLLYYEVRLVTGGLAQLGWAEMTTNKFHPNTEQGEGVGDDAGSYAFDGSRRFKFHNGKEDVYGQSWKAGDVVGCFYNVKNGEISYSLNGTNLGVAFTVQTKERDTDILFPALSCNGGEILELHIGPDDMEYMPDNSKTAKFVPVKELVVVAITSDAINENIESKETELDKKPAAKPTIHSQEGLEEKKASLKNVIEEPVSKPKANSKEPIKIEPLDLQKYKNVEELEQLGLDRLKGALMSIGVKCGGSLRERAERLFSLKGLERKDYPGKVRAKNFVV